MNRELEDWIRNTKAAIKSLKPGFDYELCIDTIVRLALEAEKPERENEKDKQ